MLEILIEFLDEVIKRINDLEEANNDLSKDDVIFLNISCNFINKFNEITKRILNKS